MRDQMKKNLMLLIATLMTTALTACGGKTAGDSSSPASETTTESALEEAKSESVELAEASKEESSSTSVVLETSYTDNEGRVYITYTAKELVDKIVAMDEAGVDLFNDVSELSPDGYIQIPVHFMNAGDGSSTDKHNTEIFMLIKDYRELNGEPGFVMGCSILKNTTDAGIDALTPTSVVYFYDNDAPENKAYAGSDHQEKITSIITTIDDPYQSFMVRCKISELCSTNTTIKGEKAAHGYSCILYITDIVAIK